MPASPEAVRGAEALRPLVVLHVIESFGAGSAGAMQEFVDATPELTHVLLRAVRPGEYVASDTSGRFARILELPSGTAARIRAVRSAARQVRPDVVHAHSSFAGLYVRLALRTSRRRRTVYSPHCFAFERRDLPLRVRSVIAGIEWLLAFNTDVVAACSLREQEIAARLPARRHPVYVPNTPRAPSAPSPLPRRESPGLVSIGRLGPQKDPARFAAVVEHVRSAAPGATAVWVGDGDSGLRAGLEHAGVRVTGWMAGADVSRCLAESDVYVHTAAWEGFPLSVLEAVTAGRPVVARKIGAFLGMPREWLFSTDHEAAAAIIAAHRDPERNLAAWRSSLSDNNPGRQREALRSVYRSLSPAE